MAAGLTIVHPEMLDFDSGQGRSNFATAGVAALRRKPMNGSAIIAKEREHRPGPKDAISGWTLTNNPCVGWFFIRGTRLIKGDY